MPTGMSRNKFGPYLSTGFSVLRLLAAGQDSDVAFLWSARILKEAHKLTLFFHPYFLALSSRLFGYLDLGILNKTLN